MTYLLAYFFFPMSINDVREHIDAFEEIANFLQVFGLIDWTHIPIKGPSKDREDYYNRKRFYSVVTQAVVDANGKCLDVSVGCPGSIHDARVYRYSELFERIERGEILTQPSRRIGGYNTPPLLLGDSAYPLSKKLLKPYPENAVTGAPERRFNLSRCRTRVKVKQGFGELQGRRRCLSKRLGENPRI